MKIAILGIGRIGSSLARAFAAAGHDVRLANRSGGAALAALAAETGAQPAASAADAAQGADLVVVSVPLHQFAQLPAAAIGGAVVIDTCNYYPGRDGAIAALDRAETTTSEILAAHLDQAKVVKAFNSILAEDLARGGRDLGAGLRQALPIAADDATAKAVVAGLVRAAGLDPVDAGVLREGWRFERARPAYCRALPADALRAALAATTRGDFVAEGSWRL